MTHMILSCEAIEGSKTLPEGACNCALPKLCAVFKVFQSLARKHTGFGQGCMWPWEEDLGLPSPSHAHIISSGRKKTEKVIWWWQEGQGSRISRGQRGTANRVQGSRVQGSATERDMEGRQFRRMVINIGRMLSAQFWSYDCRVAAKAVVSGIRHNYHLFNAAITINSHWMNGH